jgi:hypothetical protein
MHLGAEIFVSIEDQLLQVRVFEECFAKLLHNSFAGGVLGDRAESGRQYRIPKFAVITVKNPYRQSAVGDS